MMPCILRSVLRRRGARIAVCLLLGGASTAILPGTARAIGGPPPVTATVEGEVRLPGSYTLPHGATLSTLVVAAGGYTDNADLAAATLTRESAKPVAAPLSHPRLLKGSPADLPLTDGDTLRIPRRTPGASARSRARPAGDDPFTGPNNFGVTGLLEIPTARVMKENRYRLGATQVHPYRYYFGTVGLFDRVEVNGRVTQVIGVPGFNNNKSYGDFKDKAVDAKLQFLKEGKYLPALAFVVSDPTGTRLYASQAIVASKRIFPFDFTVGYGNGRLGKNPLPPQGEGFKVEMFSNPAKWAREALPFGGIQYAPTPWLSLLAEYSPIRYERQTTDPAQKKYFPTAVRSPLNFGVRVKPLKWLEIDASWQRGNEIGVTASVAFDIGRPLVPIYDPPYLEAVGPSRAPLQDRIAFALADVGFSDIGVSSDGFILRVDAQNDRYFFAPRAVEVLLATIAPFVPPNVEYVRVQLKENGIPVAEAAISATVLSGAGSGFLLTERIRAAAGFPFRELRRSDPPNHTPPVVRLQPQAVVRDVPQRPFRLLQIPRWHGWVAQRVSLAGRDGSPRRRGVPFEHRLHFRRAAFHPHPQRRGGVQEGTDHPRAAAVRPDLRDAGAGLLPRGGGDAGDDVRRRRRRGRASVVERKDPRGGIG